MRIPSFTDFEELFERLVPRDSKENAYRRWMAVDSKVEAWSAIDYLRRWFGGYFMARPRNRETEELELVLKAIASVYEVGVKKESRLYRCVQLQHVEDEMDLAKLKHAQTANKDIQSWSTDQSGAEWFYRKFAVEVNHGGRSEPHKAWVILSTEAKNVEVLVHYESAMRFFRDLTDANPLDVLGFAKEMLDFYNISDMLKNKEVICQVPNDVPVKIHKVLVPPLGSVGSLFADLGRAA
jgi:hypothetical protein